MSFFKKLMCKKHEVDMTNLEVPVCINCKEKFPILLDDRTLFSWGPSRHWRNPDLNDWFNKKAARNLVKIFKQMAKKKEPEFCPFCGPDGACGHDHCPYTKGTVK